MRPLKGDRPVRRFVATKWPGLEYSYRHCHCGIASLPCGYRRFQILFALEISLRVHLFLSIDAILPRIYAIHNGPFVLAYGPSVLESATFQEHDYRAVCCGQLQSNQE